MKSKKSKEKSSEKPEGVSMRIQPKMADDWELEDAVRTLARAEEIKADDKMMGKIRPMLDKKVRSIEALKELYNSKYNKPSDAMEEDQDGDED
jgi:RPA family protein